MSTQTRIAIFQIASGLKALRAEMFETKTGSGKPTMGVGVKGQMVVEAASAIDQLPALVGLIAGLEEALYRIAQGVEDPAGAARQALQRFRLAVPGEEADTEVSDAE